MTRLIMFCALQVTPYTPVLEDCVPEEMKEDFQKYICAVSKEYWQLAADLVSSSRSKWWECILISAWWMQGNKPAVDLLQLAICEYNVN